jgi:hypothetical protein
MTESSNLQLIIDFNDFNLDDDEKVRNLRQELEAFEGIKTKKTDSDPPIGHSSLTD